MPISIEWLPDEPVLLATCTGFITVADFTEMFQEVAELVRDVDGHIFRIADYRRADSSFADIIRTVQESVKGMPGSPTDNRIKTIYVGTSQWISLARTAFQNQPGGWQIPAFHSIEDALEYIHLEMLKADKPLSTPDA